MRQKDVAMQKMLQENAAQEMLQENAMVGKRFFISKRQEKMDEIDGAVLERLASKLCAVVYEYDNNALQDLESFCNDDDNIRAFISRIEKADELCLESLDYQQALIKGETFMFPLPNYKSNRYMTYYLPETSKTPTGLRIEQLSKIEPDKKNILHFYSNGDADVINISGPDEKPSEEGLKAAEEIMTILFEKVVIKEQEYEASKAI